SSLTVTGIEASVLINDVTVSVAFTPDSDDTGPCDIQTNFTVVQIGPITAVTNKEENLKCDKVPVGGKRQYLSGIRPAAWPVVWSVASANPPELLPYVRVSAGEVSVDDQASPFLKADGSGWVVIRRFRVSGGIFVTTIGTIG
ncbi:MAG: hypothetical protein WCK89_24615, partial [bacterium]